MRGQPPITHAQLLEVIDYDPVTGVFRWKVAISRRIKVGRIAGAINSHGYRFITIFTIKHGAHQWAWFYQTGEWPKEQIDHINGDRVDNRFCNLREATLSENNRNVRMQKNNTSGRKGVCWHKLANKWMSTIMVDRKAIYLGLFDNLDEASAAYTAAAAKYHLNFANNGHGVLET